MNQGQFYALPQSPQLFKRFGDCGARQRAEKRRYHSGGSGRQLDDEIFLQKRESSNAGGGQSKYPTIIPKEELRIAGVITAVVRKYHK